MTPQLFTTTDGKTARLKGPILIDGIERFDKTEYPIHSDKPIEAGTFEGELVWQYKTSINRDFVIVNSDRYSEFKTFEGYQKEATIWGAETRLAVQPVPVKGEEKPLSDDEMLVRISEQFYPFREISSISEDANRFAKEGNAHLRKAFIKGCKVAQPDVYNSAIEDAIRAAHAVPDYFAGEKEQKWFIEILTKMIK